MPLHAKRQKAWDDTEQTLLSADLDYTIIHPEALEEAQVQNGQLKIGGGSYRFLVMPQVEILSRRVLDKIKEFKVAGGSVLWVDEKPAIGEYAAEDTSVVRDVAGEMVISLDRLSSLVEEVYAGDFDLTFEPGPESLKVARFRQKDGRRIYYLVNRMGQELKARIRRKSGNPVLICDPVDGTVSEAQLPNEVSIGTHNSLIILDMPEKQDQPTVLTDN